MFLLIASFMFLCPSLSVSAFDQAKGSKQNSAVQIIKSPGTYKEAEETCGHLSDGPWQLPSPDQSMSELTWHEHLIENLRTENYAAIWLALTKERLPGWKNIDNSIYAGRVQENGDVRKTCGLVKLRYEAAVSDFCESSGYGYICQIKNCTVCHPEISPHNCLIMEENCYILGCDAGSWFEASNRCVSMGTTLATLRSEDEVVTLVRKIKRRPNNPCQHFWVGNLKAKWSFRNSQGGKPPDIYYWYIGHPVPGFNCATFRKFDVGYYWASTDCQARHEFVCIKENGSMINDSVTVTSRSQENTTEEILSKNKHGTRPCHTAASSGVLLQRNFYLLIVTLVMMLILLILIGVQTILLMKRCNIRLQGAVTQDSAEKPESLLGFTDVNNAPSFGGLDQHHAHPGLSRNTQV